MEAAANSSRVKAGEYEYMNVPIRVDEYGGGGFEADDISGGGGEEAMSSGEELPLCSLPPLVSPVVDGGRVLEMPTRMRTSELTISFEGQVYVFPAVTPEKQENEDEGSFEYTRTGDVAAIDINSRDFD